MGQFCSPSRQITKQEKGKRKRKKREAVAGWAGRPELWLGRAPGSLLPGPARSFLARPSRQWAALGWADRWAAREALTLRALDARSNVASDMLVHCLVAMEIMARLYMHVTLASMQSRRRRPDENVYKRNWPGRVQFDYFQP
jgi:hypothetical protein